MSLAGTIFAIPTDEARGQVAQFLLLTMAPFAILAPFIGPLLDRFRHGRRWAIGTTLALRAFLCWVLADAVARDSAWLFAAALGCLVASKAYSVTRASAVPRLLPPGFSLVNANSRTALAGVAGMAVGGVLAGAVARIGPEWSLRLAFAIYVVGTVLAIRLPSRVDSSAGERDIADTVPLPVPGRPARRRGPWARARARVAALPTSVLAALVSAMGTRMLIGFLTLFVAFLMREHPLPGVSGTVTLALVVGAAGAGNALGTVIGNTLAHRRPEVIISAALLGTVVTAIVTAVFYSLWTLLALGLVAGLATQLVKVGTDAVVQRDIEESGADARVRLGRDEPADGLGGGRRDRDRAAARSAARLRRDRRAARPRAAPGRGGSGGPPETSGPGQRAHHGARPVRLGRVSKSASDCMANGLARLPDRAAMTSFRPGWPRLGTVAGLFSAAGSHEVRVGPPLQLPG